MDIFEESTMIKGKELCAKYGLDAGLFAVKIGDIIKFYIVTDEPNFDRARFSGDTEEQVLSDLEDWLLVITDNSPITG